MRSLLSDKVYDVLKWIAIVAIPALGEAYTRLANVWGLPYGTQIAETALVVTFILGALLGISTISYNKAINADLAEIKKDIEGEEINEP